MTHLGTMLGVDFWAESYPTDGFQLTLKNEETDETLFDNRMVGYTLWEAVTKACYEVWAKEIEKHNEEDLPYRIASALGIAEEYEDEANCHKCGHKTHYEEMTEIGLGSGIYECEECWRSN